ncbi:hypothetical protein EDI_085930 [Entamoeba dispar SAW760]|uniref:MRH domain-containing protein n=1 Tax=Entamoeba dispar (strain ATCC PRA-260 / SAW760) TaxID=370354 RepID=B0EF41_ENTDS|nr:uncharacterized protein EDI_085930 [Entamoeba dispar SAW760]EDR26890.1 hypothetical protein EDI_085930 [Entamoeba dispar SAW760]|eukprot:EDR26890.1 hypothetical protein EDI_085930 [Entamoeba dispar SAW760]
MNDKKYQCSIPEPKNQTLSNEEQLKKIESELTNCYSYNNGYYLYVLCPGKNITQTRVLNGFTLERNILGQRLNFINFDKNSIQERYVDGSYCLGKKGNRKTIVEYSCLIENVTTPMVISITEVECVYHIKWQIPAICKHQSFVDWNLPKTIRCCADIIQENETTRKKIQENELQKDIELMNKEEKSTK